MSDDYLNDEDVKDVIKAATSAGFDQKLKKRESFSVSRPAVQQAFEDIIRRVIQDNAQYIVPVTWSDVSAIGLPLPPKWNAKEAVRLGLEAILDASVQEIEQYGQHPHDKSYPWAAADAYLHSAVRASAEQQSGYLRQGYLAVGLAGISLVGIRLNWSPEFQFQKNPGQYFYLRSKEDHVRWQRRELPPEDVSFEFFEVAYIPYENIQEMKSRELLRIDGLSAFVTATGSGILRLLESASKESKAFYKSYMKTRPKERRPFRPLALEASLQFPELVIENFQKIIVEIVSFGLDQASGVPLQDGIPAQQLFSTSLAASIVDSKNGTSLMIESVFSELDIALALIEDLRAAAPSKASAKSTNTAEAPQFDIAAQLQKLAELHATGALTDEEFREAKMKLLS